MTAARAMRVIPGVSSAIVAGCATSGIGGADRQRVFVRVPRVHVMQVPVVEIVGVTVVRDGDVPAAWPVRVRLGVLSMRGAAGGEEHGAGDEGEGEFGARQTCSMCIHAWQGYARVSPMAQARHLQATCKNPPCSCGLALLHCPRRARAGFSTQVFMAKNLRRGADAGAACRAPVRSHLGGAAPLCSRGFPRSGSPVRDQARGRRTVGQRAGVGICPAPEDRAVLPG